MMMAQRTMIFMTPNLVDRPQNIINGAPTLSEFKLIATYMLHVSPFIRGELEIDMISLLARLL